MKKRITRCLALLLAVVMVLSVMPAAMAEETTQTQTYTKVTEAPADWSGTYLIVSEGDKLIMDGSLDKLDVEGNKVDVTITDSKITGDYAKYAFTVEPMTGGYAIKSASGKYISGKSGSNKLNSGSTQSLNTIELTSGKVIVTSDGTTLQYNNAAKNGTRFRYYKSQNQQPISLYKIETAAKQQVATPTATPAAGEVAKGTKVEFKCKTEGAKISYKTTGEYTEYTDPGILTRGLVEDRCVWRCAGEGDLRALGYLARSRGGRRGRDLVGRGRHSFKLVNRNILLPGNIRRKQSGTVVIAQRVASVFALCNNGCRTFGNLNCPRRIIR